MLKAFVVSFLNRTLEVGAPTSLVRTLSIGGSVIIERFGATPQLEILGGTNSTVGYSYRININQSNWTLTNGVIGSGQGNILSIDNATKDVTVSSGDAIVGTAGKGFVLPGGMKWLSGTGTPEGAVTAPVGSLFSRSDGGAGTTLYVKESGAGNTGWVAK